jgi:hypothetical protein
VNARPAPAPMVAPGDEVLVLRDELRELFALLGMTVNVQSATVGLRRSVVLPPLSLRDARRLVDALAAAQGNGGAALDLREKVREANRLSKSNRLSKGGN